MASGVTFPQLFLMKIDSCIAFLSGIPSVSSNPIAMSKIGSFRDFKWCVWYVKQIKNAFRTDPEAIINRFIADCGMKVMDFSHQEREKLKEFLDCFVSLVEMYDTK